MLLRADPKNKDMHVAICLSPSHLLTLCSLVAHGSRADLAELIGPNADEHDRKLTSLKVNDLMLVVAELAKYISVVAPTPTLQPAAE